jgi:two-component SAPR family response regulator
MNKIHIHLSWFSLLLITGFILFSERLNAREFSETSFLIANVPAKSGNQNFWDYIQSDNNSGIRVNLTEYENQVTFNGTSHSVEILIDRLLHAISVDSSKIIPVFIEYEGNISVLDSIISESALLPNIFFLPRGEAWPTREYLIQANRRILFFVTGDLKTPGRMLHPVNDYIFQVSATGSGSLSSKTNQELLMIKNFEKLPVNKPAGNIQNLVPDYINFILETWTKFGKRPNFIFVNNEIQNFNFIISQLNSFTWINGTIKGSGKTFEKVYWKNPEVSVTGGRFSFPYRGGEELILTPFVPGFRMIPEQIIVTGEMEVPEKYDVMASPLKLGEGLTASFNFDLSFQNALHPSRAYSGENYFFTQDIERGTVLRLPENASINLKSPEAYGLRNSSFSVSCFVKFSEILEFGDNAVLGNYESEYRRGLHLILRSGHPYFGLWANDYVSEEKLEPNTWYHLVWRYIIETGEQAIFLNGRNIGSSDGHPPFTGTGDIHLGSALSQGASLRGYIDELHFWNRPLGAEEITRLALNEEVVIETADSASSGFFNNLASELFIALFALSFLILIYLVIFKKRTPKQPKIPVLVPEKNTANQITLFGGFRAIDRHGNEISGLFTPKVKELLLFTLLSTLKNGSGAAVAEIDENLWPEIQGKKVTNNRAVTLNKLRKILNRLDGLEIITQNGILQASLNKPFFCDYVEAFKLCHLPGGMDKKQLELFFHLVKKGRFLQGANWPWLDEMRGYTGNQVIDNLLKLAEIYKNEKNTAKVESIAKRILEYDDLNEEAIWLYIWYLRQTNNTHQAKFYFESFRTRYSETLAEQYPMNFEKFNSHFAEVMKN